MPIRMRRMRGTNTSAWRWPEPNTGVGRREREGAPHRSCCRATHGAAAPRSALDEHIGKIRQAGGPADRPPLVATAMVAFKAGWSFLEDRSPPDEHLGTRAL